MPICYQKIAQQQAFTRANTLFDTETQNPLSEPLIVARMVIHHTNLHALAQRLRVSGQSRLSAQHPHALRSQVGDLVASCVVQQRFCAIHQTRHRANTPSLMPLRRHRIGPSVK